jgi:hypothetical protein
MQTPAVKAGVRALWFQMAETLFSGLAQKYKNNDARTGTVIFITMIRN